MWLNFTKNHPKFSKNNVMVDIPSKMPVWTRVIAKVWDMYQYISIKGITDLGRGKKNVCLFENFRLFTISASDTSYF